MILTLLLVAPLLATPEDPLATERLLATLPEAASLEGPPVPMPDGSTHTPKLRVSWSPDGATVAYVAWLPDGTHPVIGEVVGPAFDYLDGPVFGAGQVAFRAGLRKGKDRESWWIWSGEPTIKKLGKAQDWIGAVALSPVDGEAAYWTQPGARVVADGSYNRGSQVFRSPWKKGKKWGDATSLTPPTFAADGRTIHTAGMKGSEWFVLTIDKKAERRGKQGYQMIYDLVPQPAGDELAVVAQRPWQPGAVTAMPGSAPAGMQSVVQVGDHAHGEGFDGAGCPTWSPDGEQLALKVRRGGRYGVVLADEDEPAAWHDFVTRPVFAPGGERLAYVASEGAKVSSWFDLVLSMDRMAREGTDRVVVRDLVAGGAEEDEPFERVEGLTWSPDGLVLAFAAEDADGWRVHAGDVVSPAYDQVGELHFSEDGGRVSFGARSGRELWWRVLELAPAKD